MQSKHIFNSDNSLWAFYGLLNVFCLLSVLYVTACLVAIYSSSADYDYKYVTTIFNENTIYTKSVITVLSTLHHVQLLIFSVLPI